MQLVHFKGPHGTLVQSPRNGHRRCPWLRTPNPKLTNRQTQCCKTILKLANCSFMTQSVARGEVLGAGCSRSCGQCQLQCSKTGGLVQIFCYWGKRSSSWKICIQLLSRGHLEHQIFFIGENMIPLLLFNYHQAKGYSCRRNNQGGVPIFLYLSGLPQL